MTRISVVATIRGAYLFTFRHLGAIIGLIWLPMIILTVLGFFVRQNYYEAMANALASNNYANLGPAILGLFFYLVAALLLWSMMAVPVVQLALGTRKTGSLAHFAFGAGEWRLFKAAIALAAFLLVPMFILAVAAVAGLGLAGTSLGSAGAVMGLRVVVLLFYAALVFFGLRFGFLLPAVAVAEDQPVLARGWSLSAGNFWRILAVAAAVLGPLLLVVLVAEAALEGPAALAPNLGNSAAMTAAQLHSMSQNMPLTAGISFLIAPLALGQTLGAAALAFRALAGQKTL